MVVSSRPLEIQQLEKYLREEFAGIITGTGHKPLDKDRNFLSKAVAACFLMIHAGASKEDAVAACIDGGGDNGIDSLYISPTGVLWLVQSKYIHEGSGEPALGDAGLFRDGVNAILNGQFDRCATLKPDQVARLRKLMDEPHHVVFALVYTGTSMDDTRRRMFGDVETRINSVAPGRVRFVRFGLSDFHDALTEKYAEPDINGVTIELRNYGVMQGKALAYYGTMQVKELAALYQQHGDSLVRANIRRYRGLSEVNEDMRQTLHHAAANFFYFNNGITLVCRSIRLGAPHEYREVGRFHLDGVSIINGAQTAGTVAQESLAHYDVNPAEVLVTCIELPGDDDSFADEVTRCRNSQNAVTPQDFAALDDNQESWRRTLQAEGISYIVKRGVEDGQIEAQNFSVQEAAECLALLGWKSFSLLMEHPMRLWDRTRDMDGEVATVSSASVYKTLFPDTLTARQLWRTVQIARRVRQTIEQDAASTEDELAAGFARHSIRLLTHVMLLHLKNILNGESLSLAAEEISLVSQKLDAARAALQIAHQEYNVAQQPHEELFTDLGALLHLRSRVLQSLNAGK